MENKVLVTIIVPLIEKKYEVFLPVNKKIGEISSLLAKGLVDVSNGYYIITNKEKFYNRITGKEYNNNVILQKTDIRYVISYRGQSLIFKTLSLLYYNAVSWYVKQDWLCQPCLASVLLIIFPVALQIPHLSRKLVFPQLSLPSMTSHPTGTRSAPRASSD